MKKTNQYHLSSSGFSLVEISIVIIIIGLLIAGVAAGTSLINQTRLQGVITDYNKYTIAIESFTRKYNKLPGDMDTATSFFGGATQNGNGNELINFDLVPDETFLAWQHLSLAGFIAGSYSGLSGTVLGVNIPESTIDNAGFIVSVYFGSSGPPSSLWLYNEGTENLLQFGKALGHAVLTPSEAFSIDSKMDDGKPATGNVLGTTGFDITGQATDDSFCGIGTIPNRTYNLSATQTYCILSLKLDSVI